MMLDMQEHVEGDQVLDPMTQRSRDVMGAVAVMMNRPHREEGRQALADEHSAHMVAKDSTVEHPKYEGDPSCVHQEFPHDDRTYLPISAPQSGVVEKKREHRTE